MTGVLASFVQPLAAAQVPIFAISTFVTDYVLIKRADLERAVMALAATCRGCVICKLDMDGCEPSHFGNLSYAFRREHQ